MEHKDIRHSGQDFLDLLANLSPIDIQVAKQIYLHQQDIPERFYPDTPNQEIPEEKSELKFVRESGWNVKVGVTLMRWNSKFR